MTEFAPLRDTSVDPDTGAMKDNKEARYGLIPVEPLRMLARHYSVGSRKYDDHNWRKGYAWSWSYDAAQRHMNKFWGGEDIDEETGTPHVISAAWHMFALAWFMVNRKEKDDRPK